MSSRTLTFSLAASALFPILGLAQTKASATNATAPTVYSNPRASSDDPRVGLKAGIVRRRRSYFRTGEAGFLPKPPGFAPGNFFPNLQPPPPPDEPLKPGEPPRAPAGTYGSTNSDLAFSGNHVFVGNYNGINFYDIDNPAKVKLTASLVCPGGQGDVSVYGHLMFMSAEAVNARLDCGTQGVPLPAGYVPPPPATSRARHTRRRTRASTSSASASQPGPVPRRPHLRYRQSLESTAGGCGADLPRVPHAHAGDRSERQGQCVHLCLRHRKRSSGGGTRRVRCRAIRINPNPNTSLFSIDIIRVPLAHPELAKIVSSPRIFTDSQSGAINGLWKRGNHGEGTQTTEGTDKCHDITVYSAIGLAAGACSGNGILLDIHDPAHPVRIDAVSDPNYSFWHSATFNNAGTKVLFTDEWGGGGQPRCRAKDPMDWGADAIFELSKGKLKLASYYKMPAVQTEFENCVAHNGSLVPIPGRDIFVQAWYQGGVSVMDFTDAAHPVEIAYFDRGPLDGAKSGLGGYWSAYWYNGYIYGSEIARGVDVFKLVPSKFITQNEIDASNLVHYDALNVQNQQKITWPANFVVARAYLDQLTRSSALAAERIAAL